MNRFVRVVFYCLMVLLAGWSWAQIPDKFENLKVLPADISKKDMMDTMKGMSGALGVRCWFCHVGEEGQPLSSFDFVSDEKDNKVIARGMMEMTRDINKKYLVDISAKSGHNLDAANCRTCHRGLAHPRTLSAELARTLKRKGVGDTVTRYRKLRDHYYGSDAYDFSESTLNGFAEELTEGGNMDAALSMLALNLEYHPKSGETHYMMGEVYARMGQKGKAIASLEKALEMMPGNPRIQKRIEQLKR